MQLGHGTTTIECIPRLVKGMLSKKVMTAACSYHHSVLLCTDGTLFSFGRNDNGQLGHNDTIDKKTPYQIMSVITQKLSKTIGISCGQFHTVMLTADGIAYSCGKNDYGQICLENTENIKIFTKILGHNENGDSIKQVCCGYYHTLLLSQNGTVTGFGRNDYGQLGEKKKKKRKKKKGKGKCVKLVIPIVYSYYNVRMCVDIYYFIGRDSQIFFFLFIFLSSLI